MAFFRYPGGKRKLRQTIVDAIKEQISTGTPYEYREPFCGGASIGMALLNEENLIKFRLNDFDPGIAAIWKSVIFHDEKLKERITGYIPRVEDFEEFKTALLNYKSMPVEVTDLVDLALKKIVIHQISYSGLGTKSGGPLGGKKQNSQYKIDCRWSPEYMNKKIVALHKKLQLKNASCTNEDFSKVILEPSDHPVLIYLDPPYFDQGQALYQFGFQKEEHERLCEALKNTPHNWVLSYDDVPEIRDIYSGWATVETIEVIYSINAKKTENGRESITKKELLIRSHQQS